MPADADFNFADLFPVSELPRRLPVLPGGARFSTSTIFRWLNLQGVPGRKTLRSVQLGKHRYVTDQWVREFVEGGEVAVSQVRTPARKEKAKASAIAELERAGI